MLRAVGARVGRIVGVVSVLLLLAVAPAWAGAGEDQYGGGAGPGDEYGGGSGPGPGSGDGDEYGGGSGPSPGGSGLGSEEPSSRAPRDGGTTPDRSASGGSQASGGASECEDGESTDQGSATPLEDRGNVASIALARTGLDAWLLPLLAGASIGAGTMVAIQRRSRPSS